MKSMIKNLRKVKNNNQIIDMMKNGLIKNLNRKLIKKIRKLVKISAQRTRFLNQ